MKLQTVPAARGALWVRQGFRAFIKRPIAFAALFAVFMAFAFLLALLPWIGALIVLGLLPVISLGFMIATRHVVVDQTSPSPRVFVEPLQGGRAQAITMLQLGAIYALATFAVMWIADRADGGAFEALMASGSAEAPSGRDAVAARLAAPGLAIGLVLRFGLLGLLSIPFWHAPALVHWDRHSAAKALFSSTLACWRNRGAFTVFALAWFGVIVAFGMGGSLLAALVGRPGLFALAALPISLALTNVFYVSLYFTFADCFVAAESPLEADAA